MVSLLLTAQEDATGPARIRHLISGPARPADVLGRFATALYLRLAGGEVIALLSSDAVRLPIGLILPTSSREFPLTHLYGQVAVGSGGCTCRQLELSGLTAGLAPSAGGPHPGPPCL